MKFRTSFAATPLSSRLGPPLIVFLAAAVLLLAGCKDAPTPPREIASPAPAISEEGKPKNQEALERLARALQEQNTGRYEEAYASYHEALKLDPDLRGVECQLGIASFQTGDHEKARRHLNRSIEEGEEIVASRLLLGVMLAKEKNYAEAEEEFLEVLELAPAEAQAHYNLGEMFREQGRFEEAILRHRQAVLTNPQEPLFAFKLRLTRIQAGEMQAVETETREQLLLATPTGDWLMTAAAVNLKRAEWKEAAKMLAYAAGAMQPQMFFAMLQDPIFTAHAGRPELQPFYQVEIMDASGSGDQSPTTEAPGQEADARP